MENSSDSPMEDVLNVLVSIYPEIKNVDNEIKIKIPYKPDDQIHFKLITPTNGQILLEFSTVHFEPLSFKCLFPISTSKFSLESSWLDVEVLRRIKQDIENIINDNSDDDYNEFAIYEVFNYIMVEAIEKYKNDIFPSNEFVSEDFKDFRRLQHMCTVARLDDFKNERYSCSICLEYKDGKDGILLDCDHAFCRTCFKEYADQMINSDDVTRLQCPNCPITPLKNLDTKTSIELKELIFTRKISPKILQSVISEVNFEKYETLLTSLNFSKYQQYYPYSCGQCPRCSKWLFRDDNDDQLMKCKNCSFSYCFDCRHSWHGIHNPCGKIMDVIPKEVLEQMLDDNTPKQVRQRLEVKFGKRNLKLAVDSYVADKAFREAVANDDDLIDCPSCGTVITKADGCNKMKCTLCNTSFCYLCGKKLNNSDPYYHYNDMMTGCYGRLFEGMEGVEPEQINPLGVGFPMNFGRIIH